MSLGRGMPPFVLREVLAAGPLACSIPEAYGGRGAQPREILSILEAASYESLPLGLVLAINGALLLEPLAKYGSGELKGPTFARFIQGGAMGGLMITEPAFGTDALSMQTSFEACPAGYSVRGTKHWAGLSGWADFWIVTARRRRAGGGLHRDIDFFVCDSSRQGQVITVEELFPSLGLYMIPYGRNRVDVLVPAAARLEPASNGIGLLRDLLHRSRMRFAGMATGFIRRILDDSLEHCRNRRVGGRSLISFDQVRRRLAEVQAGHTISAAFCRHSSEVSGIGHDLGEQGLVANVHKTVLSDLMQQASQSSLQLSGAKGYRLDHPAGRAVVDSRPFQIFEGSNDVMCDQIAASFLKPMRQLGQTSLIGMLRAHGLTSLAADRFSRVLDFHIAAELDQRKMVDLGRILARVVSIDLLERLASAGFDPGLVANAVETLRERIHKMAAGFHAAAVVPLVEDYAAGPSWQACLP